MKHSNLFAKQKTPFLLSLQLKKKKKLKSWSTRIQLSTSRNLKYINFPTVGLCCCKRYTYQHVEWTSHEEPEKLVSLC